MLGEFEFMDVPPLLIPKEITYEWSQAVAKTAARRCFRRGHRNSILFGSIAVVYTVVLFAVFFSGLAQHQSLAWIYLVPAILCLFPLFRLIRVYFNYMNYFKALGGRRSVIRVEEEQLKFQTDALETSVRWAGVKRLWKCADFWCLICRTPGGCLPLPVTSLGPEVLKIIEDKVRRQGGLVG